MRKKNNRELEKRIDEVLYYIWDPIGVSEEPNARSEYTSYVPEVLKIVERNCDIRPISECLAQIISKNIDLSPDIKRCDFTAEILLKYKKAIENNLN
jgi:hypothetical protein